MHKNLQRRAPALPRLSAVVCAVVLVSTVHLAQAANPQVKRNYLTTQAGDYWTPERMRNATPMEMPSAPGQGEAIARWPRPKRAQGPAMRTHPWAKARAP